MPCEPAPGIDPARPYQHIGNLIDLAAATHSFPDLARLHHIPHIRNLTLDDTAALTDVLTGNGGVYLRKRSRPHEPNHPINYFCQHSDMKAFLHAVTSFRIIHRPKPPIQF